MGHKRDITLKKKHHISNYGVMETQYWKLQKILT